MKLKEAKLRMENDKAVVLIVDDDRADVDIIINALEDKYKYVYAYDGKTAIDILKNVNVDLILLDILMPGMDGFEFCRKMKGDGESAKIPVIFLTAKHDLLSVVKGFEEGAVDYVTKPFEIMELRARVKTHIDLKIYKERLENTNLYLEKMVEERTAELKISKEKAEDANRKKQDFIANINHELRTPLNGIMGFAELLSFIEEDKEKIPMLKEITTCAETLLNEIDALVDFSLVKMNKYIEQESYFFLKESFDKVVDYYKVYAEKKGISFIMDFKNGPRKEIFCYKSKLNLILANLVSNAVKFTHRGLVEIVVEGIKKEAGGTFLSFIVKDTGNGMEEEAVKKLFNEFQQGEYYLTKKYSGFGIGLSFVKMLLQDLKGEINIESELGLGTMVRIKVPVGVRA